MAHHIDTSKLETAQEREQRLQAEWDTMHKRVERDMVHRLVDMWPIKTRAQFWYGMLALGFLTYWPLRKLELHWCANWCTLLVVAGIGCVAFGYAGGSYLLILAGGGLFCLWAFAFIYGLRTALPRIDAAEDKTTNLKARISRAQRDKDATEFVPLEKELIGDAHLREHDKLQAVGQPMLTRRRTRLQAAGALSQ